LKRTVAALIIVAAPLVASATDYQVVERPRQQCWNEQVAVQSPDYGGAVLGGIAGGILGNQVGRGNGRVVATAVGAATGALVGDRMSGGTRVGYQTVQQCRTVVERVRVPIVYEPAPVRIMPAPVMVVQQPVYLSPEPYPYRRHHHHYYEERWHGRPYDRY